MSPNELDGGASDIATSDDLERELNRERTKAWVTGQPQGVVRFRGWNVLRLLGRGGMGGVFLARSPELERDVALKLVARAVGSDRLTREARALAKIDHPNVVKVHAVDLQGPAPVIEMAYVEGVPLSQWVRHAPTLRSVLEAYVAAAGGVGAIHGAGLVHRDIKPDNILRKHDGGVVVVDLGLAVDEHAHDETTGPAEGGANASTVLAGTPGYIAPEVLLGRRPTAAGDQFSLGCALFESVAGSLPFDPFGPRDVYLEAIRRGIPAGAPTRAPRWLRRALQRSLQFDPAKRYSSTDAFISELQRGLARRSRWWRRTGLALTTVAVTGLGWLAADRPEACASAETFLSPPWNGAALDPVRARIASLDADAGPRAIELLETAVGRAQDRWAKDQVTVCYARQAGEPTNARAQCLASVESAVRSHVQSALAEGTDALGRVVHAAAEVERIEPCDAGAEGAPAAPWTRLREDLFRARLRLSRDMDVLGQFENARRSLLHMVDDAEGIPRVKARALYQLGHVLGSEDMSEAALDALDEARTLAFAANDDALLCEILVYQAKVWAHVANRPQHAARDLELAAACLERTGNRAPLTWADLFEAKALHAHGEGDALGAISFNEQALARRREAVGAEHYECSKSHHNLGNAWALAGDLGKAQLELERALELRIRVLGPEHPRVANVLFDLGDVLRGQGRLSEAAQQLEQALAIYENAGANPSGRALSHLALAQVALATDDPVTARHHLDACAELEQTNSESESDPGMTADRLHTDGLFSVQQRDFETALGSFARATEVLRRHDGRSRGVYDSTLREIEMLMGLARYDRIVERARREEPWLSEHLATLGPGERGRFAWYIGDAAFRVHEQAFAVPYFRVAVDAYADLSQPSALQELHWMLAQALSDSGKGSRDAREHAEAALALPTGPPELHRTITLWLESHPPPKDEQ